MPIHKTGPPSFGASAKQKLIQKVHDLAAHLEALDSLVETQAAVIFSLRNELDALRNQHVAEHELMIVFVMRQMSFKRKVSNIADTSGTVPTVIETLMDRYRNGGRDMMLAALEAENAALEKAAAEGATQPDDAGQTAGRGNESQPQAGATENQPAHAEGDEDTPTRIH